MSDYVPGGCEGIEPAYSISIAESFGFSYFEFLVSSLSESQAIENVVRREPAAIRAPSSGFFAVDICGHAASSASSSYRLLFLLEQGVDFNQTKALSAK